MSLKYNEYNAFVDFSTNQVVKKELTERGFVMISKLDAMEMNADVSKTKLFYELVEEVKPIDEMKKDELQKLAEDNGIEFKETDTKAVLIELLTTNEGEQ